LRPRWPWMSCWTRRRHWSRAFPARAQATPATARPEHTRVDRAERRRTPLPARHHDRTTRPGRCRCQHCRDALAAYRAGRRANGRIDRPRSPRPDIPDDDRHLSNRWFRQTIWTKAVSRADLGFHVTPHGLRHSHASWLLAGGADLQVVKERLGNGSITTTEQYLHILPSAGAAALHALDTIRGPRR
jgi:hypothetical protein